MPGGGRQPREGSSEATDQGLKPVITGPGLGSPSEAWLSSIMTHTLLKTSKVMELPCPSGLGSVWGPEASRLEDSASGDNTPTPPTAADCLLHKKLAILRQEAGHYKTIGDQPRATEGRSIQTPQLYTRMYTHAHVNTLNTREPEASKPHTAAQQMTPGKKKG